MNLKAMLEKTAAKHPGKTAIVLGERRISYAELDEATNQVANTLVEMGLSQGDRVAIMLPNSPEFVTCYFGAIKAGGIATPLDIRHKIAELACLFDSCQPKVLVTASPVLEPIVPSLSRFDYIKHVIDAGNSHESRFPSYRQIIAAASARRIETEPAPDDIATISYAGGPTNQPQGAMLSHHSLARAADIYADGFRQTVEDIAMLFALPMYHMFGLASLLLTSINKGSTIVLVPGTGRSISSFLETIEREKGTMFLGVPYIYALANNVAKREGVKNDLSSLRLCASAAAPISPNIIREFKQYYDLDIIDIWGLTEAVSHVTSPNTHPTARPGSCGQALPGWEIKIVDDNGRQLPAHQAGEIIVKGLIMDGYYNNPRATAEVIENGWLHTGDIGCIDEDGYLFITGRKKPMLILKGQNIYPSDIEQVLSTHPKIAAVRIVGIPDELRGEIVRAVIVLKPGETATEQEIRQFCQERMADYKLPKQIIFSDALP